MKEVALAEIKVLCWHWSAGGNECHKKLQ